MLRYLSRQLVTREVKASYKSWGPIVFVFSSFRHHKGILYEHVNEIRIRDGVTQMIFGGHGIEIVETALVWYWISCYQQHPGFEAYLGNRAHARFCHSACLNKRQEP